MVGLGLHVFSNHLGGIVGIHYKVNSLINPPAFAGVACAYSTYINNITVLFS